MRDKIKWLWRYYRQHKKVVLILLTLTPIQAAITVTIPRMVGFTIDYIRTGAPSDDWLARWLTGIAQGLDISVGIIYGLSFIALGTISFMLS